MKTEKKSIHRNTTRHESDIQSNYEDSQKKVKAFADDILLQCQNKGFTAGEVDMLLRTLNQDVESIKVIESYLTFFRCEV